MDEEPARRAKRNLALVSIVRLIGLNGGARAVTLPLTAGINILIAREIVATPRGVESYALYSVLLSVVAILAVTDFGIGAALTNRYAGASPETATAVEAGSIRLQTIIGLGIATVAAGLGAADLLSASLGLSPEPPSRQAAPLILILSYAVTLPFNLSNSALLGSGRYHLTVLSQVSSAPLSALVMYISWHVISLPADVAIGLGLSAGIVGPRLLAFGLAARLVGFRITGWRRNAPGWRQSVASVFSTAGPMLVVVVTQPLALQTDRLILSHVNSDQQVAAYGLVFQFYSPVYGIIGAAGLALWPYLKRPDAMHDAVLFARLAFATLGFGGAIALYTLVPLLSHLVAGEEIVPSSSLIAAFCALLLVQSLQIPLGMAFTNNRGLRFQSKQAVAMLVLNLPLTIVGAMQLGALGCALSSAIAIFVCQTVPLHWRYKRYGMATG